MKGEIIIQIKVWCTPNSEFFCLLHFIIDHAASERKAFKAAHIEYQCPICSIEIGKFCLRTHLSLFASIPTLYSLPLAPASPPSGQGLHHAHFLTLNMPIIWL